MVRSWFKRALLSALVISASVAALADVAHAEDVRIEGSEPGLKVWNETRNVTMTRVRIGRSEHDELTPVYAPLCESLPCTANMALGTHGLALSRPGEGLVFGEKQVNVGGPGTVSVAYHDRWGWRMAGLLTVTAGVGGGAVLFARSMPGQTQATLDPVMLGLAIGAELTGLIGGLAMLAQKDSATFTVTPLQMGEGPRVGGAATEAAGVAGGAGVRVRF